PAPMGGDVLDDIRAQVRDGHVEAATRLLLPVRPDAVAYACSSGSFVGGPGYDRQIVAMMERVTGVPATTGTTACQVALTTLGVRHISVVTPYDAERNDILVAVLEC